MTIFKFHSLDEGQGVSSFLKRQWWKPTIALEANIICFNGGADIATEIYGEHPALRGVPLRKSYRDDYEVKMFKHFGADTSKLKLGICRGAQLLNCLNGGTLWQDVDGHGSNHTMTVVETGHVMRVTSTHHQMMRPNYKTAVIIGVSDQATYKIAEGASFPENSYPDDHKDAEIVYYPDTNSLCIQGHPEYEPTSEFADYCIELIQKYLSAAPVASWGSC